MKVFFFLIDSLVMGILMTKDEDFQADSVHCITGKSSKTKLN